MVRIQSMIAPRGPLDHQSLVKISRQVLDTGFDVGYRLCDRFPQPEMLPKPGTELHVKSRSGDAVHAAIWR